MVMKLTDHCRPGGCGYTPLYGFQVVCPFEDEREEFRGEDIVDHNSQEGGGKCGILSVTLNAISILMLTTERTGTTGGRSRD